MAHILLIPEIKGWPISNCCKVLAKQTLDHVLQTGEWVKTGEVVTDIGIPGNLTLLKNIREVNAK
jgi:hypothetical protein